MAPPRTGRPILIRIHDDTIAEIDRWAAEAGCESRSEAVRRLLRAGLDLHPATGQPAVVDDGAGRFSPL